MTTSEALKAQIPYPLSAPLLETLLVGRELDGAGEFTAEVMRSKAFVGAHADALRHLLLYPNSISEGGISIGKAESASILASANALYRSIGEPILSLNPVPTITCY